MCGRFTLGKQTDEILDYFESHFDYKSTRETLDKFAFKFNIPPGTDILSLHYNNENYIECHPIRWGLIPSWSKGIDNRFSMNNARAETITSKPAFRTPFKQQRCLIITDGFYEWHSQAGVKQPYYITRKDQNIFTFAGIWDQWISPDQSNSIQSCSIITTEAKSFMTKIHTRMPVIISPEFQTDWLSTKQSSTHSE
ncbi:MAG: SOS response-associated peptidase, partial [Thiohalomonadales bacterium]